MKRWTLWLGILLLIGLNTRAGTLVEFRTAFGSVVVELLDEEKPVTVQNFLRYIRQDRWKDMFSHRLVPGFILQGGGFAVTNRNTETVGFTEVPDFGPITNEFNVGPKRSNVYGTIAMAKLGGNPNSASSEWFFNLANNSANLDNQNGGFTVFGRVIAGTNVLNVFNTFTYSGNQTTNRLYNLLNTGFPFDSNPNPPAFPSLNRLTAFAQVYTNLMFLTVQELQVAAAPLPDGRPGLTWKSIPGMTNQVQGASRLVNPDWQVLTNLVPVGETASFTESNPNGDRYYRVKIVQ
ncbi:MAG: peptidylprolyl isomerase [Verrucomicrobia bacterium]|nr:peptidylprolyl isomerase [Verrucomicrobiota bacterium]